VSPARRDPRRRPHHGRARGSPGWHRPAPPAPPGTGGESLASRRGPRKLQGRTYGEVHFRVHDVATGT
jgi:hypothetical protein